MEQLTTVEQIPDFLKEFCYKNPGGYVRKTNIFYDRSGERQAACALGQRHYKSSFPCGKCGKSLRYSRKGICVQCAKDRHTSRYVSKRPPKSPEYQAALNGGRKRYRSSSPCPLGHYIRLVKYDRCLKCNNIKVNISGAKRAAAKLQRVPQWVDYRPITDFYIRAHQMTEKTGKQWHVDHIIPLQGDNVSGFHVAENLQLLLDKDNISKHNRFVPYYETPDGSQTPIL